MSNPRFLESFYGCGDTTIENTRFFDHFGHENIPFGIANNSEGVPSVATRHNDLVFFLAALAEGGYLPGIEQKTVDSLKEVRCSRQHLPELPFDWLLQRLIWTVWTHDHLAEHTQFLCRTRQNKTHSHPRSCSGLHSYLPEMPEGLMQTARMRVRVESHLPYIDSNTPSAILDWRFHRFLLLRESCTQRQRGHDWQTRTTSCIL